MLSRGTAMVLAVHARDASRAALAAGLLLVGAPAARAVVQSIDASVTSQVTEFLNQDILNSDLAFEDLDQTTGNLPMTAVADLFQLEGDGKVAGAMATTTFTDPRLSPVPDPGEFGIDVAAFSQKSDISYEAQSQATETRDVAFTSAEIGRSDGTALEARSYFFVDGYLLVWAEPGTTDLSGTTARVVLSVQQTRPGTAEPATVLRATLTLAGSPDGTASISTQGDLQPEDVMIQDLTGLVPDFGPTHIVVIPSIAVPYIYPAAVGETFRLKAEIAGSLENKPSTGAAVELGVPLFELAALINELTGSDAGWGLVEIFEADAFSRLLAAKPLSAATGTQVTVVEDESPLLGLPAGGCALMGIESALLVTVGAAALSFTSRRRS